MKRKIVSICLVAVIALIAIAGASLAYFTDTDEATNTFAVGNVKIKLIEQQRNDTGTALEDFEQNKTLMPLVGDTSSKDKFGLTTAKNYVDKVVTVKNTGNSDAYVRVLIAIPADLEGSTPATNIIHWDKGDKFTLKGDYQFSVTPQPANPNYDTKCVYKNENKTATIDGIVYNIHSFTYTDALSSGKTTEYASLVGFYLDKNIDGYYDEENEKFVYTTKDANGNTIDITYDLTQGVKIPVYAQAIQAAGFNSATEAFTESALPINPWE